MYPTLPRDAICRTARFRFGVHTLRFETATWNQSNSEFDADDIQDEQHVTLGRSCSTASIPMWFLSAESMHLFPTTGAHNVSTLLSQNNNTLFPP